MPNLVGQCAVQVVVVHEVIFLTNTENLVVDNNAIDHARGGRQVGKSNGRGASIEFRYNPNVHVVFSGPVAQGLHIDFG